VLLIDDDEEIRIQKDELKAALEEQQAIEKQLKVNQIKSDAKYVFKNTEISPKKLAKRATLEEGKNLTITPYEDL
jgi:hypothetical protein